MTDEPKEPILPINVLPFDGPPSLETMESTAGKDNLPVASIRLGYDDSNYLSFFAATSIFSQFNELLAEDDPGESEEDEEDAAIEELDDYEEDDDDELIDVDEDDEEDDELMETDEKNRKFYRTPQNSGFMQDFYQDVDAYDRNQLYSFNLESDVESTGGIYFSYNELRGLCEQVFEAAKIDKVTCTKFNSGNRPLNDSTIWITFFKVKDHEFAEVRVDNLFWTNSLIFPKKDAVQFFQSVYSAVTMLEEDFPTQDKFNG